MMTAEQFQLFMQHLIPTMQNQILQQIQQPPGAAATTPSGRKVTLHPKCFSRFDKFAGGEEKWREWSYDFRMATATQNATVFEILNWIEENGEHTFGEIMETDPEGIQNGRFNGMETIDKEIFQHLVLSTVGGGKDGREGSGERGLFRSPFKVARQVLRRTVARIMRIHKECMYPSQVKDVKLLTSATFQWEDKWNALLKEMKDPSVQELWKMAAFLELCPNDIKDQVFLQIDEINENYAVFREKVLAWTANKVEQEKSSGRAPMDIGEVDDSQSALQSHLDWPGQWQVDEWDMYRAVPGLRVPRNVPLLRRGGAQACRVLEVLEGRSQPDSRCGRAGGGGYRTGGVSDVLDGGSGGRSYTPSRGFLVQAKEGGTSL